MAESSEKMDMSLDDIIKQDWQSRGGRRAGRRGGGRPFNRRSSNGEFRGVNRGGVRRRRDFRQPAPYTRTTEVPDVWRHDMYQDDGRPLRGAGNRSVGAQRSAKLLITNLDYGVNDQDIRELFADFGSLKHSAVHYDRSGRSLGTADVEYMSAADAVKAMKQYNNVPLDGKPMKIQFEGAEGGADRPRNMSSRLGPANPRPSGRGQRFSGGRRSFGGRRGGRGGRGRGRGRGGRDESEMPSREQLDAELDAYNSKMDTE